MINKLPIYQQLHNALKSLINEEDYSGGDKFLTERAICEEYNVSRVTANKALSSLVSEGILEFRKGVGTFVIEKSACEVRSLIRFSEQVLKSGKTPAAAILGFDKIRADECGDIPSGIPAINPVDSIYRISRLRTSEGNIISIEYWCIIAAYCPDLPQEFLTGSIQILLQDKYNLNISEISERIIPEILTAEESEILQVEQGQAGFAIFSTANMEEGKPLWWKKTVFRPGSLEIRTVSGINPAESKVTAELITP